MACVSHEPIMAECHTDPDYSDKPAELVVEAVTDAVWTTTSEESTFSSPALADLTGEGVLDIVQGFGQDTFGEQQSSVVATNGATGAELWRSSGHEDLIGTAQFMHIGGDSIVDVVIGGRRGALLGIDGSNGNVIWTFDDQSGRWFNFYTPQIIDDQNDDGINELVATNGGLVFDEPEEGGGVPDPEQRNLGTTFVIDGSDGSVVASLPAPDRREQYMSPLVIASKSAVNSDSVDVLIGTGGETLPGSIWRVPLETLVEIDPPAAGSATELVASDAKGFIAAPSLGDLNGDCVLDVVAQSFDGTVAAFDGATNTELWALNNPGFETYSTPTLGYFTGDDPIPDVFVGMAKGKWPEYKASDYLLIDGSDGTVVWRTTQGTFAPSGFVAADLNGDGRDEVIYGVNDLANNTHQLYVLDTSVLQTTPFGPLLDQTTFSSPWLGDIDSDGSLDLIVTESAYQSGGPASVHRFELPWVTPDVITWGGYLGTSTDGSIESAPVQSG